MAFQAGQLTRRMRLLNPVDKTDARGTTKANYKQDGPEVYAYIRPVGSDEPTIAEQHQGVVSHVINVYHTARITLRTVLEAVLDDRTFEVKGKINVEERDRYLELHCREKIA